jgi:hypothetical protein
MRTGAGSAVGIMTQREAEDELERLKNAPELQSLPWAIEWRRSAGSRVPAYGRIGIVPNPYEGFVRWAPDTDFRVVYQDFDGGRSVDVTGWTGSRLHEFVTERATADGQRFAPRADEKR